MDPTTTPNYLKGAVEALLFMSEKPITLEQIREVLEGVGSKEISTMVYALQNEYTQRQGGTVIVEIAGGYQMLTNPAYAPHIRKLYRTIQKEKLSKPALETLAIIAYKQPVARLDIEVIRGVNSDGVTAHLLIKGLIKIVGRKDVPGKPYLYGTTKQFLEYFGLKSLDDLPKLEDFPSLASLGEPNKAGQTQTEENNADAQSLAGTTADDGSGVLQQASIPGHGVDLKAAMEAVELEEQQKAREMQESSFPLAEEGPAVNSI